MGRLHRLVHDRVRVGLAGVDTRDAERLGLSLGDAFEPCLNVKTAARLLAEAPDKPKLPVAVAGLIFFSDPVTFGGVTAIFLGFVSGLLYTLAKNNKSKQSGPTLPTTNQAPMSASARSEKDAASS